MNQSNPVLPVLLVFGCYAAIYASLSSRYSPNGCRGRGHYLLPKERKYPAPTKKCTLTALTFASWPNNLPDAAKVAKAALRGPWGDDEEVQEKAAKLLAASESV